MSNLPLTSIKLGPDLCTYIYRVFKATLHSNRCPASDLFAFSRMRFVFPSTADIDACGSEQQNIGLEYPGTGTLTKTGTTLGAGVG